MMMRAMRRIRGAWLYLAVLVGAMALSWPAAASAGTALDPPTGLYQSDQTETSITVSWTPSDSPGVTGYEIWPNGGAKVDVGADATSYTMSGLTCGGDAWIEVWAVDAAGDMSPEASTGYLLMTSACNADIEVLSDTPSVSHAQVGQDVTFTSVARNNGPDSVELAVNTMSASDGLALPPGSLDSLSCDPPDPGGNDGSNCEYGYIAPGDTVTEQTVQQIQNTNSGYANAVACVTSFERIDESNFGDDCAIATVAIDPPTNLSTLPIVGPVAAAGAPTQTPPAKIGGPTHIPPPGRTGGAKSGRATSCPAYTRHGRQYTILTHRKLTCAQGRTVIGRADGAVHRTGAYVKVSSWLCRREPLAGRQAMWLEDCTQAQARQVIWTEQRRRLDLRNS